MSTWASTGDVVTYTGHTPAQDEVDRAELWIEQLCGAEVEDTSIGRRDRKRLRAAVAYQTVWMSEHPEIFTAVDVDDLRQDGVDAIFAHANAGLLAPMAHRALRRLSWRGTRSRTVGKGSRHRIGRDDWDYDTRDRDWRPLRGSGR
ncbi:hypothetical protein ACFVWN_01045 [Nocardiopsis flavescens]|uniref:hypothetical protein n=1 Tax=Nocardiopsis flavescens TaxID=758803 RepID=UPI003664B10B